jgi:hypothetical protein
MKFEELLRNYIEARATFHACGAFATTEDCNKYVAAKEALVERNKKLVKALMQISQYMETEAADIAMDVLKEVVEDNGELENVL